MDSDISIFESSSLAARTLAQCEKEIIKIWSEKFRQQVKAASELSTPILVDTIPLFLRKMAEALSPEHPQTDATDSSSVAIEHGSERARLTRLGPQQLIREYQLLRDTIFSVLNRNVNLCPQDIATIHRSIDRAVQEAMASYFLIHQRIREQFTATLSHDLRNPIGNVKMASELILDTLEEMPVNAATAELKDLASRILKNSLRADRMIQDLLDASALQVGEKLHLNISQCDLSVLINDLLKELEDQQKSRLILQVQSIKGHWDGENLKRALENLISNAFKYGSRTEFVTIRTEEHHQRVTIEIHNKGTYIPIEDRESLFQAFRRSEDAKKSGKKGWGLGLALVRTVSESLGGSIQIDSNPESGTTFIIDIPLDSRPFQPVNPS